MTKEYDISSESDMKKFGKDLENACWESFDQQLADKLTCPECGGKVKNANINIKENLCSAYCANCDLNINYEINLT